MSGIRSLHKAVFLFCRVFNNMRRLGFLALLMSLPLVITCTWNPERDNPADPGSIAFDGKGTLQVNVASLAGSPLEDAYVQITETGVGKTTDSNGNVTISAPLGWVHVSVRLDGYKTEEDSVNIYYDIPANLEFSLNGLPCIDSLQIVSGLDEQYPSGDYVYYYIVSAFIHDPDGSNTISEVLFSHPIDGSIGTLIAQGNGNYRSTLNFGIEEGDSNLIASLDRKVRVIVKDQEGDSAIAEEALYQYFKYDRLREDMNYTPRVNPDDPLFRWLVPDLDFTPLRYLSELFDPDDPGFLMDTLVIVVPDTMSSDTLKVNMQSITTISGSSVNWRLTLYDYLGNWVRTPLVSVTISLMSDSPGPEDSNSLQLGFDVPQKRTTLSNSYQRLPREFHVSER